MNLRPLSLVLLLSLSAAFADDAVNKLLAGHEQSLRSARLPLHRKLLGELQKLETQYRKGGNRIALTDVQVEIAKVKQWLSEASQPVGSTTGPQPSGFKLVYPSGGTCVLGSWENGTLKIEPKGFTFTNNGPVVELAASQILTGGFEAVITYEGLVYMFSAMEADFTKYSQFGFSPPQTEGRHTIKIKRTAAGAVTAELDGQPVTVQAFNGARMDMYVRLSLRLLQGSKVHLHEFSIKDLSVRD